MLTAAWSIQWRDFKGSLTEVPGPPSAKGWVTAARFALQSNFYHCQAICRWWKGLQAAASSWEPRSSLESPSRWRLQKGRDAPWHAAPILFTTSQCQQASFLFYLGCFPTNPYLRQTVGKQWESWSWICWKRDIGQHLHIADANAYNTSQRSLDTSLMQHWICSLICPPSRSPLLPFFIAADDQRSFLSLMHVTLGWSVTPPSPSHTSRPLPSSGFLQPFTNPTLPFYSHA